MRSLDSYTAYISSFSLVQTNINSRECPYCGSHHIHSNGNYKGRKRYLCKSCGKSYNDLTKTPFSGIHNLDKIMRYLSCMINGDSIRKASEIVQVSTTTSFIWRHKLLTGLNQLPPPNMKNVKEIMEVEIPYSHKGQTSEPSEAMKYSKVSALFVCDRIGKVDSDSVPQSQNGMNPLLSRIKEVSNEHTDIICPTKLLNILDSSKMNVKCINSSYATPTVITGLISFWHNWMKRFHGVATKYLSNYLHWFDYIENTLHKQNRTQDLLQLLLKHRILSSS